jgi:hypothetical protein
MDGSSLTEILGPFLLNAQDGAPKTRTARKTNEKMTRKLFFITPDLQVSVERNLRPSSSCFGLYSRAIQRVLQAYRECRIGLFFAELALFKGH